MKTIYAISSFFCDGQNLDLLLKYIANVVEKHTDSEVVLYSLVV